jgi:hypothetical protein
LGLDGIAYWTLLADFRHNGSLSDNLINRAWLGRRTIALRHHLSPKRIRRLNDRLLRAGLVDIDRAGDLFAADLEELRSYHIQPDAYIYMVHEPLSFKQFAELNFSGPCQQCEYRVDCAAFKQHATARRAAVTPGSETEPPPGSETEPPPVPKRNHNENEKREQNNDVVVELRELGIADVTARQLCAKFSSDYVRSQIAWVCWQNERGKVNNLSAYLTDAIKHGWQPPAAYLAAREAERQQQVDEARWKELCALEQHTRSALGYENPETRDG